MQGAVVMSISGLRFHAATILVVALCSTVGAQQPQQQRPQSPSQTVSISSLTAQGFEIKAAANTAGSAAQVFLQKGKDVFVCLIPVPLDVPQRDSRCTPVN